MKENTWGFNRKEGKMGGRQRHNKEINGVKQA